MASNKTKKGAGIMVDHSVSSGCCNCRHVTRLTVRGALGRMRVKSHGLKPACHRTIRSEHEERLGVELAEYLIGI